MNADTLPSTPPPRKPPPPKPSDGIQRLLDLTPRAYLLLVRELADEHAIPVPYRLAVLVRACEARLAILLMGGSITAAGGDERIAIRVVERLAAEHAQGLLPRSFTM